ncbi:hypothetical protein [Frateuria terrea]|uniref:Uncharacterized protein n=1 Tax=Frateuria terrea TaxID=529704 RepID=A0A1H6R2K3_9GAMM|nr:hypothetical protein [Frateuria terrea]SEI50051.1 hypothetical protein SAMN04487997_0979 [Frateuria terrea]SFP15250.1 hypothetical protein SAMN02927913_0894 [Frateuria terrea]
MRIRVAVLASLLAAGAAQAQSVPSAPPASDSWSKPAPASTASYRSDAASPATEHGQASHFKFKDRRGPMPLPGNAAQEHSGSAGVGTVGAMDRNGRPAVNCPQTPMDPACH